MRTNRGESENSDRIKLQCSCGKRFAVAQQYAGKRVKCPQCGEASDVRPTVPSASAQPTGHAGERRKRLNKPVVAMWSLVAIVSLAAGLFVVRQEKASARAHVHAADAALANAVSDAHSWLDTGNMKDADQIEDSLVRCLDNEIVSERSAGESALTNVRKRRAEFAADSVFAAATAKLDANEIEVGLGLLRKYVADPDATKRAEAEAILLQADIALSDSRIVEALSQLDDESFARAEAGEGVCDPMVTHPTFVALRNSAVSRNIEAARKARDKRKNAELKRQEQERLAAVERKRKLEEQARAEAAQQAKEEKRHLPYSVKGDTLGMSLAEFKAKYRHGVEGDRREAPFTSDQRDDLSREKDPISTLFEKAWHPKAKIVTARITFPFEDYRDNSWTPTLAAVKTDMHCYSFVDSRLYEILFVFSSDGFARILDAMVAAYGRPGKLVTKQYQNAFGAKFDGVVAMWENEVSTIMLIERGIDLKTSTVVFSHTELERVVKERKATFDKPPDL